MQDPPDFFDSFRMALYRVTEAHDEFRFYPFDMGAFVLDDPIVTASDRTVPEHRDDRMRRNPLCDRNRPQRFNEGMGGIHIVNTGWQFFQLLHEQLILVLSENVERAFAQIGWEIHKPGGQGVPSAARPESSHDGEWR